jgi:predicted acyl esterase
MKGIAMKSPAIDRPWRRSGAAAYARRRVAAALHPPVTVYPTPADARKDHDVPVEMRDGVTLRLNLFRPAGEGPFPVPWVQAVVATLSRWVL